MTLYVHKTLDITISWQEIEIVGFPNVSQLHVWLVHVLSYLVHEFLCFVPNISDYLNSIHWALWLVAYSATNYYTSPVDSSQLLTAVTDNNRQKIQKKLEILITWLLVTRSLQCSDSARLCWIENWIRTLSVILQFSQLVRREEAARTLAARYALRRPLRDNMTGQCKKTWSARIRQATALYCHWH